MVCGFGLWRRGIAFVILIAGPVVAEPPPLPTDEHVVYGIVCNVTLGALPGGLGELLSPHQAVLCEAAVVGPVHPIGSDPVRAITASFEDLVRAFRSEKALRAVRTEESPYVIVATTRIIQLATRAAMPSLGRDADRSGEEFRLDPSWSGAIVEHRVRLQYEARVSPVRFRPVEQIDQTVRVVMRRGQQANQRVFDLDGANTAIRKSQGSRSRSTEQEAKPIEQSDRLVRVLEDRIEDGALLAARLIGSAWIEAGKPTAPTSSARTAPIASETTQGGYVASRHSKVFHKADCPHVKRISPANRITFSSPTEAESAKKKPCRTCKPG